MATVILEDIYKRLPNKHLMSNEHQVILTKFMCNVYYLSFNNIDLFYSGNLWLSHGTYGIYCITYEK
jgi:hypothetical protein